MPANGHFAIRLHGAPAGVDRVNPSKFSGEVAYVAYVMNFAATFVVSFPRLRDARTR